jgi:Rrf2 family protein
MTHIYTRGCEYALRALQVMAEEPGRAVTVVQLCERAAIPEHFTRKMLQPLVRDGILNSSRGPGGGFSFGRPPEEITLLDVVTAIEQGPRIDRCILGHKQCEDAHPCPLHFVWAPIKLQALDMLARCTIADLARPEIALPAGSPE